MNRGENKYVGGADRNDNTARNTDLKNLIPGGF